jgi:signal transduction histidine kinase
MQQTVARLTAPAGAPHPHADAVRGFRGIVFIGAVLTIAVWVFTGVNVSRRLADVHGRASDVNARYLAAQQQLTDARNQVLLASTYVRDLLLVPIHERAADTQSRIVGALAEAEASLDAYVPVFVRAAEAPLVSRVRGEVQIIKTEILLALETDWSARPDDAGAFIRERVIPRREAVARVSNELTALNRQAFVDYQRGIQDIYRTTQVRVWQTFGVSLAASLGIALVGVIAVGRLETRVRAQQLRDAQLQADLHRLSSRLMLVREDERRSIARELHDEIGQMLTAAKVELAVIVRPMESAGASPRLLDDVRRIVDSALHAVRDLSRLLHPVVLDDLGLVAAIEWQASAFRRRSGTEVTVELRGLDERLPRDVETTAYRIVQEALNNVARHAGAARCSVRLERLGDRLVVAVEDDGVGFEVAALRAGAGLGLVSMRERAAQVGGSLVCEGRPGLGVRVVAELPLVSRTDAVGEAAREDT